MDRQQGRADATAHATGSVGCHALLLIGLGAQLADGRPAELGADFALEQGTVVGVGEQVFEAVEFGLLLRRPLPPMGEQALRCAPFYTHVVQIERRRISSVQAAPSGADDPM